MTIHLLHQAATAKQMTEMLEDWHVLIKVVVDVKREVMAGGGEMHADAESVLLDDGSRQDDLWGANWYPDTHEIRFEALINIRPRLGNMGIEIRNEIVAGKVERVVRHMLEGSL